MLVSIFSCLAMAYAIYGSYLFVVNDFENGSKSFMIGNAVNVAIGLYIGDLALILTQATLAYFTIPMYHDRKFNICLIAGFCALVLSFGSAVSYAFTASWIGITGTALAVFGAYRMSVGDYKTMAWMWILADVLFIYIGIVDNLPGLVLQSVLFVWHGYLRVVGKKQTGVFSFSN